ncbi:6-O-methylguanine DNA methyltransferase [Chytriomyces cf. hyalinus JEL632]|nr:6-O-methylguanine DNA methyltransferase [Chytriomyces cf. hyalinus JEL632]
MTTETESQETYWTVVTSTSIGSIVVAATDKGVCAVAGVDEVSDDSKEPPASLIKILGKSAGCMRLIRLGIGAASESKSAAAGHATAARDALTAYLGGVDEVDVAEHMEKQTEKDCEMDRTNKLTDNKLADKRALETVPIDFETVALLSNTTASSMHMRVIRHLSTIACGTLVDYSSVARAVGCTKAVRAVATVVGKNPVPLFVPCHRVIGKDGNMRGFSFRGGLAVKRRLLKMETGRNFGVK